jgi:pimeloyl-ACP methyl ester carboxylesterase
MGKAISQDGTAIAYDRTGEGEPVILVGGALCDRMIHTGLAAALAPHFTVFNYDRRGRGASDDTQPYAVERELDDLAALLDAAGGSAAAYGISSGGALVLEAAAAGLPVTKAVAYEPPYVTDPAARETAAARGDAVPRLIAEGRHEEALEAFLTVVGTPPEAIAGMRTMPFWPGMVAIAPTLAYDFQVMGDSAIPADRFRKIAVPTLIVDGGDSPTTMRGAAAELAATITGARHITLPGQTHEVAADALAPVLIEFHAEL